MKTYEVDVVQRVKVTLDESKFTPEFMAEFSQQIFDTDRIEDHVEHLAQLGARGCLDQFGDPFIEGYGKASEMGIAVSEGEVLDIEIQKPRVAA